MAEPPSHAAGPTGFIATLGSSTGRLRDPLLAWLFTAMIVLYALEGIVFELYQSFTTSAAEILGVAGLPAPLLSGVVISLSMFGGALAARWSGAWRKKLGFFGLLGVAAALQAGVVAALLVGTGLIGLLLVTTRNFPMSLIHAPVNDAIAPRISSNQRAVFLSIMSLSQRLIFAGLMFGLTSLIGSAETADASTVQPLLLATLAASATVGLVLIMTLGAARRALTNGP